MSTTCATILLFSDREEQRHTWIAMLGRLRFRLIQGSEMLSAAEPIHVVVCDQPVKERLPQAYREQLDHREMGVVAVGTDIPADVSLPADCSGRELTLACQLMAEIVTLRRQQRQERHARREMSQLAMTDSLTGLPNRRAWEDELVRRFGAGRSDTVLCLAVFDLDEFKKINDEHGHPVGDAVLHQAGRSIADSVRDDDFVARLGGDEFGLLVWCKDRQSAAALVERVRAEVGKSSLEATVPSVTASAGIAIGTIRDASKDVLFQAADAALLQAKNRGRNQSVVA